MTGIIHEREREREKEREKARERKRERQILRQRYRDRETERDRQRNTWVKKHYNMQTFAFLKNSCFNSCLAVGLHKEDISISKSSVDNSEFRRKKNSVTSEQACN